MYHNIKEHQITTLSVCLSAYRKCITISKSIKSQLASVRADLTYQCITISKSIKSQHSLRPFKSPPNVSQYQRASNHNSRNIPIVSRGMYHNIKEHQITTASQNHYRTQVMYHNIKEHQITTASSCISLRLRMYHNIKEHQITTCHSCNHQ